MIKQLLLGLSGIALATSIAACEVKEPAIECKEIYVNNGPIMTFHPEDPRGIWQLRRLHLGVRERHSGAEHVGAHE